MSVQAVGWALRQDVPSCAGKFTLVALANYANDKGHCWPSQKTLARDTSQSERAVRGHLAKLEEWGFVSRIHRKREDGTFACDYYLLRQKQPTADSADGRINRRQNLPTPAAESAGPGPPTGDLEPVTKSIRQKDGADAPAAEPPRRTTAAQKVVNRTIELGMAGERPADYGKQARRAEQLVKKQPLEYWLRAADAMQDLFPFSKGQPWDVFDLGRVASKALAAAKQQEARAPPKVDEEQAFVDWLERDSI